MTSATCLNASAPERFWAKVDQTGDCWMWTARIRPDGYGGFRPGGADTREMGAHRAAWLLTHGDIPDGMLVCHRCDTPLCVRPEHLFLGLPADNSSDMVAKSRQAVGERNARYGAGAMRQPTVAERARGERHGLAVLTADDVRDIRAARATGTPRALVARQFGISPKHVGRITARLAWAHVD